MQTKHLFLLIALAFLACTGLQAQVRIGDNTPPATGALLDLNSTAKGGLVLSNVSIVDLSKIPTGVDLFPGITSGNNDTNIAFKGAMVYHIGENDIPAGIYIWNGVRWIPPGGCDCPEGTVADDECNCYPYASFGDAGVWMTQNLRTKSLTYNPEDSPIELKQKNTTSGSTNEPRYTYPRVNGTWGSISNEEDRDSLFRAHPNYGLLYNWAAASGRITDPNPVTDNSGIGKIPPETKYRGVCPAGWHLPSDYEWNQLEKEIATNPGKYSDQNTPFAPLDSSIFFSTEIDWRPSMAISTDNTCWGRQMKSKTFVGNINPNGSSNEYDDNGFDILLVGYIDGNGDVVSSSYGTATAFCSSSSSNSDGVNRSPNHIMTNIYRGGGGRLYLFSVRCKKD
jgi:uncharacterized protein (TIGR02145 family)